MKLAQRSTPGFQQRCDIISYLTIRVSLSADFFDRMNTGELMARIKDDIDRIGDGITFIFHKGAEGSKRKFPIDDEPSSQ